MIQLTTFGDNFKASDNSIVNEVKKLNDGEMLPREGASKFFYDTVGNEGESYILRDKRSYVIFYIDHDDVIQSIDPHLCSWYVESDDRRTTLMLISNNESLPSNLSFNFIYTNDHNYDALKSIKQKKKIEIIFISIVHGGFLKHRSHIFTLPQNILKSIVI